MHLKLLLTLLLVCTPTAYSMEIDCPPTIPNEIFTTAICSHFDRPDRDALRLTCTKYFKLVPSQDFLNNNYQAACERNDIITIADWKQMGGVLSHQELARAVQNKQYSLAKWLIEHDKLGMWPAYCTNIQEAVESAEIKQMLPVIKWLLDYRKPKIHLNEFLSGHHYAKNLIKKYPEAQQFVDLFDKYKTVQVAEARIKHEESRYNQACFPSTPWFLKED